MKKFLIVISPLVWISWGLKGTLAFFGAVLFVVAMAILRAKWMEFIGKHIKD